MEVEKKVNSCQKRTLDRIAKGLCTCCGKYPARVGMKTCEKCKEYYLKRNAEKKKTV